MSWASELCPDAPSLIAVDGKTSRRSHDRAAGVAALHLVSAFATREKLVLGLSERLPLTINVRFLKPWT